jgi:ubiquinone/menaquinone biosynthesis C-methylase UbiE
MLYTSLWVHADISYFSMMLSRLVSVLNPFPGMKHLDVAGGTGEY